MHAMSLEALDYHSCNLADLSIFSALIVLVTSTCNMYVPTAINLISFIISSFCHGDIDFNKEEKRLTH